MNFKLILFNVMNMLRLIYFFLDVVPIFTFRAPFQKLPISFSAVFWTVSLICIIVKLGSLVSRTEWSNISERNSNLKLNL